MAGSNATKTAFPTFNGFAPKQGPRALPIAFDFTVESTMEFDLLIENTTGQIEYVQSVFVDNGNNPNPLVIYFPATQQRLIIPATAQGMWPVITIDQVRGVISTVVDPLATGNIILLNVPMPLTQWGPQTVNANITAETITRGTYSDFSGTTAAPATSQTAIPANANRLGIVIQNPGTNIESLYVNFTDPAAPGNSIEIAPGQIFPPNGSPYVTTEEITIYTVSGAIAYIAKEFA